MAASDILILKERPLHIDNLPMVVTDNLTDKMSALTESLNEYSSLREEREKKNQQMSEFNKLVGHVTERWMGAFKYAAEMNMEDIKTMAGIKRLRHSLNEFMREHPPVSESELARITELAHRLGSSKVKEAEHVNSRCTEAKVMLRNRQNQIRGAEKFMRTKQTSKSTDSVGQRSSRSTDSNSKHSSSRSTEDRDDASSFTESLPSSSTTDGATCVVYSWKDDEKHYDEKDSNIAVFDAAMTPDVRKRLDGIVGEIIGTEKEYVLCLEHILNNYIPMMESEDLAAVLKGRKNVLFGNVKRIYEFHKRFFAEDLESFKHNPLQIGSCFLKWERQFTLYALYKKNKPKSDQLWEDYAHIFFEVKKKELSDNLTLAEYLLKPVQRLEKYVTFLKDVLTCCDKEDPRGKEISDAHDLMKFQIRHGIDLVAMDNISNADINLKEQGCLLRQDDFYVQDGRRERLRRVFLFEQALIFTKAKKTKDKTDSYNYKHSIKTVDVGLTENIGESGLKFEVWYRRWKKGRSNEAFILQAISLDVKKAWIEDISRILWRQTTRNKEYGLTEASTGISVESTPSSIFIDHASTTYNNGGNNTATLNSNNSSSNNNNNNNNNNDNNNNDSNSNSNDKNNSIYKNNGTPVRSGILEICGTPPPTQRSQSISNVQDLRSFNEKRKITNNSLRSTMKCNLQTSAINLQTTAIDLQTGGPVNYDKQYSFTPTLKRHAIRSSYRKKRQMSVENMI